QKYWIGPSISGPATARWTGPWSEDPTVTTSGKHATTRRPRGTSPARPAPPEVDAKKDAQQHDPDTLQDERRRRQLRGNHHQHDSDQNQGGPDGGQQVVTHTATLCARDEDAGSVPTILQPAGSSGPVVG